MRNFLIIVLGLGLAASAFLTRPDREEFRQYITARLGPKSSNPIEGIASQVALKTATDEVQFKDFYLWTVVQRDGRTLYTGLFDHWIDNEQVRRVLPQDETPGGGTTGKTTSVAAGVVKLD